MPETLPAVRHKKDPVSKLLYTPFLPIVGRGQKDHQPGNIPPKKKPQNPFKLFGKPDILLLLIINALICSVFYGVIASISSLFDDTYDFLDVTTIGLCFLGIGGGMAIGSSINGRLMDMWFEKEKKKFARDMAASGKEVDMKDVAKCPDFPLERVGEFIRLWSIC
jgi:predicted secreted protein